ncbi:mucin-2-like isoform X4 [Anopheles albimanus]|uniref:mucin-2-like isoform X4 n=1 Tax=Anopheles albimanus TaxID=7167 RepID=UPI0016406222|nr:mucin-2-like isoform X4 [Anopheles albimanus]
MSKNAWVTLATNDSYSLGALVVAHSLKRVHTVHQLAVLITPGVSEAMRTKLRNVFNLVEEVNLLDSKDEANLALLKRPELGITFTKLHCWRLTQYEKCVFLDADTLVLRNSDELFEREELSAAPDIGWPDCFNSGVYVFQPSLETFASLLQFAVTNGSFDGGDQGLLNAYFSDWAHKDIQKHLPFVYNTSSVATYSYLPAFKQFGHNTKILHFIGVSKPWLQNFNSETRKVYVPSECYHLANFLQYWWDIFCEDVHSRLSPDMRTEQWVDRMIQQHHQRDQGHWETAPAASSSDSAGHQSYQPSADDGDGTSWKGHDQPTSESNGAIARQSEPLPLRSTDQQPEHASAQQEAPRQHCTGTDGGHHDTGDGGGDGGGGIGGDTEGERVDACGLAGALAQLHLGEAKSVEQEAYEEHMRRQCWETGNIDYMGRDSFDNIWRRIQQTLNAGAASDAATTATTSTTSTVVTVAPARSTRSPRSRSSTPKRDARDRSPTPQPEDKVPVEKKEAHVVPPPAIAEEDDQSAIAVGLGDASGVAHNSRQHRHHKIPPPIQYDPTTNTTTLTKRVFAGYQQFITTKSPEGRTRSHTKLVYDPSVEDEDQQQQQHEAADSDKRQNAAREGSDVVDSPIKPATAKQISVGNKEQQPATKPSALPQQPTAPVAAKTSTFSPAPLKSSMPAPPEPRPQPQQQQQQQLAQESLAGKASASTTIDSQQPVKTVRKKRTISPPSSSSAAPQAATIAATTVTALTSATTVQHTDAKTAPDQSPHNKPRTLPAASNRSSSSASNSQVTASSRSSAGSPAAISSNRTVTNASGPALPKTAATGPSLPPSSPLSAPSSSPLTPPSPPTLPTRSVPPLLVERRQQKQKDTLAAAAAATASVATSPADEPKVPPVPPRRKRESRTARLARLIRSFCTIL